MIDVKNKEIQLINIDTKTCSISEFNQYLATQAICLSFFNTTYTSLVEFLGFAGFKKMEQSKDHYLKINDSFIFIIQVERYVDNFVLTQKCLINNTQQNLKFVLDIDPNSMDSFKYCHSDAEYCNYTLYPTSVDIAFIENYLVRMAYQIPILIRVDLYFKQANDKFMIASIFEKTENRIQIAYDTYTKDCNYMYIDFIRFLDNELVDFSIFNPINRKSISILECQKDSNIQKITLDNYHLFWERLTSEEKSLVEMIVI
jgi:hypothetical protein